MSQTLTLKHSTFCPHRAYLIGFYNRQWMCLLGGKT